MSFGDHKADDADLWQSFIANRNEDAFETLYKKYYLPLTRFAWNYVKSKAIAEEIVQEFYTELWADGLEWDITDSFRSYIYKIIRNKSLNHLKHMGVKEKYDPLWMSEKENPTIDLSFENREQLIQQAIQKAVEELPERSKMTYKLHRFDGLTYQEIADVMGVSIKTVESQMTRTLKTLRERLSYLLPLLIMMIT